MQAVEAQSNPPWFIFLCAFGFRHIRRIAYPKALASAPVRLRREKRHHGFRYTDPFPESFQPNQIWSERKGHILWLPRQWITLVRISSAS
jgi:hypothetical protein